MKKFDSNLISGEFSVNQTVVNKELKKLEALKTLKVGTQVYPKCKEKSCKYLTKNPPFCGLHEE